MERAGIARIFRDVVDAYHLRASLLRIEHTDTRWRIDATLRGDRLISVEVPNGPEAAVRAALMRWSMHRD